MNAVSPALARSHAQGLTLAQMSAIDLLASGKTDTETAEALKVHRVTVTRWRNYSPEFRAALADRRAQVWGAAADRLRALLPKALDALADALDQHEDKASIALAILKLAGPLPLVPNEPTDPEAIVERIVEAERNAHREQDDYEDEILDGLPTYEDHKRAVRERLARLASPEQ